MDNEPRQIRGGLERLARAGMEVVVVEDEAEAVRRLDDDVLPDVLIQDLNRPPNLAQVRGGKPRTERPDSSRSGWYFYEEVLRPCFPQLPTIICTYDTGIVSNLEHADDYNLLLIGKHAADQDALPGFINSVLEGRNILVDGMGVAPALLVPDFDNINTALISHIARHPDALHDVSWGSFEKLVARLLQELGYEVDRTPLTRDGGVDLWAIQRSDLGQILYAIDAKKYSIDRLVGPEPVRAIYGVTDLADASVGMIVTTSRFSPAARALADQYRYRIALKDFDGVMTWIQRVSAGTTS